MSDFNTDKLIVALDVDTFEEARQLIDQLSDVVNVFKVGSQLFTACGPVVVRYIAAQGKQVFLDLKFYDIPNTVANALHSVVGLNKAVHETPSDGSSHSSGNGVMMCTVHTQGGEEMLLRTVAAARDRALKLNVKRPRIVGITVLTSDAKKDNIHAIVLERSLLAKRCGLDGVVASSQEAALIRKECGDDFIIVTPGIRPTGAETGDQKRVTTPAEAIANGSNYLVVGRPIVKAETPHIAAKKIAQEILENL